MKFKKETIIINGRKTFYWQKGFDQKDIIVFLHGFPGNHRGLVDVANNFGSKYRIIIPDMPACGESEPLKGIHNLKNYATWLDDFLKSLSLDKITIIGHSFGSRVALMFSVNYSKKVQKLVLITPVLKLNGLILRVASIRERIAKILPESLQKSWLSNRFYQKAVHAIIFKSASEKKRKEISNMDAKELKTLDPKATIELFNEFYKTNLTLLAHKVAFECLVIAGDKDEVATLRSVKELVNHLKKVSFKIMKNAGHLVPLERPGAVAKIIEDWLWT